MTDDVKSVIAEAREWVEWNQGISLSQNQNVASILERLANALEAATVAPAVDREALAREMYAADFWGDENAHRDWDELIAHPVHFERYRARADALIASGILRDVRDVQAETLEQAAEAMEAAPGPLEEYREAALEEARYLRARAQAIREARND